jgi:hypothetical protein
MLIRRNLGRRRCKKNGGWTPLLDTGLLIWLLAGYGMTLDVDGKVMYWDGMGGGPRVTFAVRPLPGADANFGGKTTLNLAGGCYGTAPVSTSETVTSLSVGAVQVGTSNKIFSCRGKYQGVHYVNGSTRWALYNGTQVDKTRLATLPTVMLARWSGAASKLYLHARTAETVNPGTSGASSSVSIGAYPDGAGTSSPTIAQVLWTTTSSDANDLQLLEQAATYYAMALGA